MTKICFGKAYYRGQNILEKVKLYAKLHGTKKDWYLLLGIFSPLFSKLYFFRGDLLPGMSRLCLPVLKFFWYFLISKILILKPFGNCNLQLVRERAFKCISLDIKSSFICGDSSLYWNTVNYHNISTRVVDWIIRKFLMCLSKYEPLFKKSLRKNDYIIKKLLNRYFWNC